MKRILSVILSLCAMLAILPTADAVSAATAVKSNGIAVLDITVDKTINQLHKDKYVYATGGTVIMYDAAGKELHRIGVKKFKGRGNASWSLAKDKKSYNLKLAEKTALIDGAGKAVDWCLLANNVHNDLKETSTLIHSNDRTGLANMMAMTLYQQMNGNAALQYQPVDLYLNGEYRGTYLLTEKVEIHSKRVDITKPVMTDGKTRRRVDESTANKSTEEAEILRSGIRSFQYVSDAKVNTPGGFLIEVDSRYITGDEASWFVTRQGASFVVKQPEHVTLQQMSRIAAYVQEMEDALFSDSGYNAQGKYYTDYLDIPSLAKRYILDCFTAQFDIFKTSCYFYIDGNAGGLVGKLMSGPAWDYDFPVLDETDLYHYAAYRTQYNEWSIGARKYTEQLLTRGDFVDELYRLNQNTFLGLAKNMNTGGLKAMRAEIAASQAENDKLWDNDFENMADKFMADFNGRYQRWSNTLWSQGLLMGVTVTLKGDTLYANVNGTAESYRWYSVNEDGSLSSIPLANASSYTPTKSGRYCVRVNGKPIGAGKMADGTRAGTMMYSNTVDTGCVHQNLKVVVKVDPTCSKAGAQQCWRCQGCGQMFSDKACTKPVTFQPEIPATGNHKWGNAVVTKEATTDTDGVRTYTCSVCKTTRTESIPHKGGATSNPSSEDVSSSVTSDADSDDRNNTVDPNNGGDNTPAATTPQQPTVWHYLLYIGGGAVLIAAALPIIAIIIRRRRSNDGAQKPSDP